MAKLIALGGQRGRVIDASEVVDIFVSDNELSWRYKGTTEARSHRFNNPIDAAAFRDKVVAAMSGGKMIEQNWGPVQTGTQKEKKPMLSEIREYLKTHRDLLFTFGLVLLLDQLVFKGAFRERLEGIVKGMLGRVEKSAGVTPNVQPGQ